MFDAARQNILSFIEDNPDIGMNALEALLSTYMAVGALFVVGMFLFLAYSIKRGRNKALFNRYYLSRKMLSLSFYAISFLFVVDVISFDLMNWVSIKKEIQVWVLVYLFFLSLWFFIGDGISEGSSISVLIVAGIAVVNMIVAVLVTLLAYLFFDILDSSFSSELSFIDFFDHLHGMIFGFTLYFSVFLVFFSGARRF